MRRSKQKVNDNIAAEQYRNLRYSKNHKPQYGASRVTGTRVGGHIWNVPYECHKKVFNFDGFRWTLYHWCKECLDKTCPCKSAVTEVTTQQGHTVIPDVPADKLTAGELHTIAKAENDLEFAKKIIIVNPERLGLSVKPRRRS